MFDEPAMTKVVSASISPKKSFFALSALTPNDLNELIDIRDTIWSVSQKRGRDYAQNLETIALRFPWAENPAHALFVHAMEQWSPHKLEILLRETLEATGGTSAVTSNPHLSAILSGLSNPENLGTTEFRQKLQYQRVSSVTMPLLRAYILDPISQALDRRKLGLARPMTTQDRYELLSCIWRCQQGGVGNDASPHTHLWVLIDHAEHVLDYPPAERKLLMNGILTILVRLQSYFTLWLNCADTDEACISEVKKICGVSFLGKLDADVTEMTVP